MKELPISSMNYLIKGTALDAELLNKPAMLQLITKLLKEENLQYFTLYSTCNWFLAWLTQY